MFEVGIISIIVLAVGYWVTLWLMGRHDDVLHGDFVHTEDGAEAPLPDPTFPSRPTFPPKPVIKPRIIRPTATGPARVKPARLNNSASPETLPAQQLPTTAASSERSDTLQTLLASIKRDLKDASQL